MYLALDSLPCSIHRHPFIHRGAVTRRDVTGFAGGMRRKNQSELNLGFQNISLYDVFKICSLRLSLEFNEVAPEFDQ